MTTPYSASCAGNFSWSENQSLARCVARAYWLPPGGIGNGLDAETWATIMDVGAGDVSFFLDSLREAGVPAYAARRASHGRPDKGFRIWVGTWYYSRAQDVIGRVMLRLPRPEI